MISRINLAINENGITTVGKRNNVQIGYITFLKNYVIKLNHSVSGNFEMKASMIDIHAIKIL